MDRETILMAVKSLEGQRRLLGDEVVNQALAVLREKLAALETGEVSPHTVDNGGLYGHATILFAEASGLEDAATRLDLEEYHEILAGLWQRLDPILRRYGGMIDKHSGSMVMAVFGWGGLEEGESEAAEKAVRAAMEIRMETRRFAGEVDFPGIDLRVGISSGAVQVQAVGATRETTALGDTVNLASRLKDIAGPGEVLIAHATYLAVRGIFDTITLGALEIKGKAESVQVARVRGIRPKAFHQPLPAGKAHVLVGRQGEMDTLQKVFSEVVDQHITRVINLVSPPGMGKTRLLNEFLRNLDRQGRPFVLFRGRSDPGSGRIPRALLRDILAYRFKLLESDPPGTARQKIVRGVEEWLDLEVIDTVHWIGHLAGCDFSHSPYLADQLQDPARAQERSLQALGLFLSRIAAHTPVLLALDDLQWADDSSLDGIEELLREAWPGSRMVVGLFRSEFLERRPTWPGKVLEIGKLDPVETTFLAGQALRSGVGLEISRRATGRLSGEIQAAARTVAALAGGCPLLAEELAQYFLDNGIVTPSGSPGKMMDVTQPVTNLKYHPERLAGLVLPKNLDEALLDRVARLPGEERRLLEKAAVIGPVFWDTAVGILVGGEDPAASGEAVSHALGLLSLRGLIYRREVSAFIRSEEYRFGSGRLAELIYDRLDQAVLSNDHLRIARWMETNAGEQAGNQAGLIAWHFEQAGHTASSVDWYTRAAYQARRLSVPGAAIQLIEHALELLRTLPGWYARRANLYRELWQLHWWEKNDQAALLAARALLQEAVEQGDPIERTTALNRMAAIYNRTREYRLALAAVQQAERLARETKNSPEIVMALFQRGIALYELGHPEDALAAGRQALDFRRSMVAETGISGSEETGEMHILTLLGSIHERAGRLENATECFRQVAQDCRERDDRSGLASALRDQARVYYLGGRHTDAEKLCGEILTIVHELHEDNLEVSVLALLAEVQVDSGKFEQAQITLTQMTQIMHAGQRVIPYSVDRLTALVHLGLGHYNKAVEFGLMALDRARRENLSEITGQVWRVLARIASYGSRERMPAGLLVDGRMVGAHDCYAASLQAFVESGMPGEQARTVREWAIYELQQGSQREGARLWQESRSLFEKLGLTAEVERMDRGPLPQLY